MTLIGVIAWQSYVCVCGVLSRLSSVLSWICAVSGVSFVSLIGRLIFGQGLIQGLICIRSVIRGRIGTGSLVVHGGVSAALSRILSGISSRQIPISCAISGSILLRPILLSLSFLLLFLLLLDHVVVACLALLHAQVHTGLLLFGDF